MRSTILLGCLSLCLPLAGCTGGDGDVVVANSTSISYWDADSRTFLSPSISGAGLGANPVVAMNRNGDAVLAGDDQVLRFAADDAVPWHRVGVPSGPGGGPAGVGDQPQVAINEAGDLVVGGGQRVILRQRTGAFHAAALGPNARVALNAAGSAVAIGEPALVQYFDSTAAAPTWASAPSLAHAGTQLALGSAGHAVVATANGFLYYDATASRWHDSGHLSIGPGSTVLINEGGDAVVAGETQGYFVSVADPGNPVPFPTGPSFEVALNRRGQFVVGTASSIVHYQVLSGSLSARPQSLSARSVFALGNGGQVIAAIAGDAWYYFADGWTRGTGVGADPVVAMNDLGEAILACDLRGPATNDLDVLYFTPPASPGAMPRFGTPSKDIGGRPQVAINQNGDAVVAGDAGAVYYDRDDRSRPAGPWKVDGHLVALGNARVALNDIGYAVVAGRGPSGYQAVVYDLARGWQPPSRSLGHPVLGGVRLAIAANGDAIVLARAACYYRRETQRWSAVEDFGRLGTRLLAGIGLNGGAVVQHEDETRIFSPRAGWQTPVLQQGVPTPPRVAIESSELQSR